MQTSSNQASGLDGTQAPPKVSSENTAIGPIQLSGFILRFVALITTFIATIVMGVAKETLTSLVDTDVFSVTIKSTGSGLSQLEYFIAVNVIAFVYTSASLALSILNKRSSISIKILMMIIAVIDVVMVALLFSGNGSAAAIAVLGRNGGGHIWDKTCNLFGEFCDKMTAAITLSMLGALAYFALVLLSIIGLHRKSP